MNSLTKKDAYSLPRIDKTLDTLGTKKAKVFSTLDLASGYWHIPVAEEHKERSAFTTGDGLYQFCKMPFGFTGAPGCFCRALNHSLGDSIGDICLAYVDDIIIFSDSVKAHFRDLITIFEKLAAKRFNLKLSKCFFFQREVEFLGFQVTEGE